LCGSRGRRRNLDDFRERDRIVAAFDRQSKRSQGRRRRGRSMRTRILTRARRRISAAVLALIGVLTWAAAVNVHVTPADARDVNFSHVTMHLVGVITGGATLAGAIVLIAAG
jgi:hypothetical protein